MSKRSVTYLCIIGINFILLTTLLGLWADGLEQTFNVLVRQYEFLKIIGFTILAMAILALLAYLRYKGAIGKKYKPVVAVFVTLLVSSYLYAAYFPKVISHAFVNKRARQAAYTKIKPSAILAYGTTAGGLTNEEYMQVADAASFQRLPAEAFNIAYQYSYDGLLPDYTFTLSYNLPSQSAAQTIDYQKGNFSKHQSVETSGMVKRVTYKELLW